ncbi:MAG TPA: A24 family peptidase [Telluria sp.]
MAELRSFLELLGMLVADPRTGVLLVLLAAAAVSDYRTMRIPNLLTGGGILFALVYNTLVTPEWNAGWTWAPAGMLLGFGAMLPLYALGVMGAGDVKLMAMVGAFLGPAGTANALLFSIVTGGVAALLYAVRKQALARMLANARGALRAMLWSALASGAPRLPAAAMPSVGKLPYGIGIAIGTTTWVVAQHFNLA